MNIFTAGMPELCQTFKSNLNTSIRFEYNFEQVIGFAKSKELTKLCIFIDVWNCYGKNFNCMRGQGAAEKIHEIDKTIPILIWDGREFDSENLVIPATFQLTGKVHPIIYSNELYLTSFDYNLDKSLDITLKFFRGILTLEDVPKKDCLDFRFNVQQL